MRYLLRQDLISFGDDFTIKNEAGEPVFQVDGKAFTVLREKLAFEDMQGQELAFIRERLIALTPSYEILRNGEVAAVVKKDLINLEDGLTRLILDGEIVTQRDEILPEQVAHDTVLVV